MADSAGDIVTRVKKWAIDEVDDEEVWSLMDEVIDDVMSAQDPWFCFNYGQVARTASNNFNDNGEIPPAKQDGSLVTTANIASGSAVPNNIEYLRAIPFPTGLEKPITVYYGDLEDGIELDYISWEEMNSRYPFSASSSGDQGKYWSTFGKTFLVGPAPPLAVTLSVYGVYRPTAITANADTNVFIVNADNLLRYGVMDKLIMYNWEEDAGRWGGIQANYRKQFNQLKMKSKYITHRAKRVKARRAGTWRT